MLVFVNFSLKISQALWFKCGVQFESTPVVIVAQKNILSLITQPRPCCKYNSSTCLRAHGVRRKNFKLDLMLGSCIKQRTGTATDIASQPMVSANRVTMASRVMPSRLEEFFGMDMGRI